MAKPFIDLDDTSYDIVRHVPSGETYFARFATTYDRFEHTSTTIIASFGPVSQEDVEDVLGMPVSLWTGILRTDQIDKVRIAIHDNDDNTADNEWMNAQRWQIIASSV